MSKPLPILAFLALCVACGSKFEPGGSGGATGSGADGGESTAGGAEQGGSSGAAHGGSNAAGEPSGGGDTAGAPNGGANTAGAASGGASAGGAGGASAGAGGASAGAGGGADCTTLLAEYSSLVQKARVCDPAAMDQCSASSTLQPVGCGCPTPVNAKSEYTTAAKAKYAQIEKNKCNNGPICGVACVPFKTATCTQQAQTMTKAYVCTGSQGAVVN